MKLKYKLIHNLYAKYLYFIAIYLHEYRIKQK